MFYEDIDELKQAIFETIPKSAEVTAIELEGPEIAVYLKNPNLLVDDAEVVKAIAKKVRKRIVIKSDPSVRLPPDEAERIIREKVDEDAGVGEISFDNNLGEVIIEAKKPGLVIGKNGATLREIIRATRWRPVVVREPPIESKMVKNIRGVLQAEREQRKEILKNIGWRIHRPSIFKNGWLRIITLGGFREVGRTAILVQTPESSVLIDCGINVGGGEGAFPHLDAPEFDIEKLDAVIVTHAHLDHSGFVPFLFKYGYEGPVYCTTPTRNLMTLLQLDYLEVAEREGKITPYTQKDVKKMVLHTITLEYGEVTDIAPDVRLTLHNAGHILGSAIVHLHIGDGLHNIAYTGDFKFSKTRLFEPACNTFPRLETIIIESTYGGPEDIKPSRKSAERALVSAINTTLSRGGKILIPVLGVGRAQELMLVIEEYMRRGMISEVPVYIDGMISEATAIHTTHPEYLSRDLRERIFHQGSNPFLAECFETVKKEARPDIVEGGPCIIMATSGMLSGGPSVEYFRVMAPDPKNCLLFVTYQVEGTLGRRIQKGWREVPMRMADGKTEIVPVKMEVKTIEGFSGHSDRRQIINYLKTLNSKLERVITCHGEGSKCVNMATLIHRSFEIETRAPQNLETIRLR
ncbi:MAG: beta-CASP ribonuclease aCPSF1 [Candidatus Jordarchaeales archaeon]|nr:beta-CASP ribonuclease aCPSF1 [Candidatus Jordarchaeia archaeon]